MRQGAGGYRTARPVIRLVYLFILRGVFRLQRDYLDRYCCGQPSDGVFPYIFFRLVFCPFFSCPVFFSLFLF